MNSKQQLATAHFDRLLLPCLRVVVKLFLPFGIPLIFYIAATECGWHGIISGRIYSSLFLCSLLALTVYFILFGAKSLKRSRSWTIVNFTSALLSGFIFGWSYNQDQFLNAFESSLKKTYDTPQMQMWAIDVLTNTARTKDIPRHEYPKWVINTRFPQPTGILIVIGPNEMEKYVKILWGSGVIGQWGLIVGSQSMPKQGRKWVPGVYFFVSPKPFWWKDQT